MMANSDTDNKESLTGAKSVYNLFRDSPLRYLGYANEVGESFRYQLPRLVTPSYFVAFSYCFLDAASCGYTAWTNYNGCESSRSREAHTAIATCDTLLWQTLASVMIPGYSINLLVKASRFAISRASITPSLVAVWGPTGFGLASIPVIIQPIDHAVDTLMDSTVRSWLAQEE
jgi:mitochondrial fission process protein 1